MKDDVIEILKNFQAHIEQSGNDKEVNLAEYSKQLLRLIEENTPVSVDKNESKQDFPRKTYIGF